MQFFIQMDNEEYPGTPIHELNHTLTQRELATTNNSLCGKKFACNGQSVVVRSDTVIRDTRRVLHVSPVVA